jgi:hypothetical protein
MHGRGEESVQGFGWITRRKENLEDQGIDGIGMDLKENGCGIVEWIQLAHNRGWCRSLVNTVMILLVLAPRN